MAIAAGFSKTVTDGLILGYDTADLVNSYLGRPTTNLVGTGMSIYNNVGGSVSATLATNGEFYRGAPVYVETLTALDGSGVSWLSNGNNPGIGVVSGGGGGLANRYTGHSIFFKTTVPMHSAPIFNHYSNIGGWQSCCNYEDMGDGWFRAYVIWYNTVDGNDGKYWAINPLTAAQGVPITIYWAGPFKEDLNVQNVSQYTVSSRSNTQSLIDFKRVFNLDVTNVSFNSNVRPLVTFDGTNDSITAACSGEMYCLEMVLYNNNAIPGNDTAIGGPTTYQTPISWNGTSLGVHLGAWTGGFSNEAIHIWNGGGATSTKTARPVGYHHVLFNWNGSSYDIWVDGDKEITYPISGTTHATRVTISSALRIGGDPDNYFFNGEIPVVKTYNRALTTSEILQNFSTYRARYKIAETYRYYEGADATPFLQYWNNSTTSTMADFGGIPNVTAHGWASGPATYTLTLNSLPAHSQVRYKVFWHCVDSVDNETSQLFIGDGSSELEILRFTKLYNAVPSISVLNAKSEAPWSGSKTYTYRPWAGGAYNADGYLLVDSGWIDFGGTTFVARHVLGADQPASDEAMYLSHVEVLLRY